MHIEQLVHAIQQRPGMFMKNMRLDYIYYLISGYCGAQTDVSGNNLDKYFCRWFEKWLREWMQNNSKVDTISDTVFWYENLLMISENEEQAVKLFFKLFQLFLNDFYSKKGYFAWREET